MNLTESFASDPVGTGIIVCVVVMLLLFGFTTLFNYLSSEPWDDFKLSKIVAVDRLFNAQKGTVLELVNDIWKNDSSPYLSGIEVGEDDKVIGKLTDYEMALKKAIDIVSIQLQKEIEKLKRLEDHGHQEDKKYFMLKSKLNFLEDFFNQTLVRRLADKVCNNLAVIEIRNGGHIVAFDFGLDWLQK